MLKAQQQHLVNSLHGILLGIFTSSSPVTAKVPVSHACTAVVHNVNGNPFTLSGVRHRAEFPQLFLIKKTFYFPVFCLLGVGKSSWEALFILCVTGIRRRTWYTERIEKNAWLRRRLLAPSLLQLSPQLGLGDGEDTETVETEAIRRCNGPCIHFRDNFRLSGPEQHSEHLWLMSTRTDGNHFLLPSGLPLWSCSASRYSGKGNVLFHCQHLKLVLQLFIWSAFHTLGSGPATGSQKQTKIEDRSTLKSHLPCFQNIS